jgi:hypothetical protein
MTNPIALHDSLRDLYLRYLDSAMPLRHDELNAERQELFRSDGIIGQPPLIEPIPRYAETVTLADACAQLAREHRAAPAAWTLAEFAEFAASGLFPDHRRLYSHQLRGCQKIT